MGKVFKYTVKQYAILTTLIHHNGVLYLQGTKVKLHNAVSTIRQLKRDGLISYQDINTVIERTRWGKFFEVHLKEFKHNKFIVMDIDKSYVYIKLDT